MDDFERNVPVTDNGRPCMDEYRNEPKELRDVVPAVGSLLAGR